MINSLYRFNKWLDDNELIKLLLLLSFVGMASGIIVFSTTGKFIFISIALWILIAAFTYIRTAFQNGRMEFDKSKYKLPEIGDVLVIQKEFWYDGSVCKTQPHGPGAKPNHWYIEKDSEWRLVDIIEKDADWVLHLVDGDYNMVVRYFESRKYWKSKTDIRNDRLKKIGI